MSILPPPGPSALMFLPLEPANHGLSINYILASLACLQGHSNSAIFLQMLHGLTLGSLISPYSGVPASHNGMCVCFHFIAFDVFQNI